MKITIEENNKNDVDNITYYLEQIMDNIIPYISICNDSIGSYEYWGKNFYDDKPNYLLIESEETELEFRVLNDIDSIFEYFDNNRIIFTKTFYFKNLETEGVCRIIELTKSENILTFKLMWV